MTPVVLKRRGLTRPTLATDTGAITANVRTIRDYTAGEVMAVVKSEGFGHGLAAVARAALAGGATRFGVTSLDEALTLRAAGLSQPVLSWLNPVDADFARGVAAGVDLAVPGLEHLHAIAGRAAGARVHLHLDTGMARDGAPPEEWVSVCVAARDAERAGLIEVVGVMGHLACAAQPSHPANVDGRARFDWGVRVARAAGLRPRDRHLAATAATLSDPRTHHTMSRIGAGLVGIDESGTVRLKPALRLDVPLVAVRAVRPGTPVGYGHAWRAASATRLGLIPIGYADGLPRCAGAKASVQVRGVRRPLAGHSCMDMSVVDLGHHPAEVGDVVTVFGPGADGEPTTAEWARWAATVEHEIVTGLGSRLRRIVGRTQ